MTFHNPIINDDFPRIPFGEIELLGQRNLLHLDLFVVSWILGRFCNYSWSYCWPYASVRKPDHRPLHQITNTIDEIKRQARARNFNSFHFSFSGGEPSYHPDYLSVLSHLADDLSHCRYQSVHMTTNLSRPLNWYKDYAAVTSGLHRVSVTASFHREFAKFDSFSEKLLLLQDHDINVTINLVMVPERFEELWQFAQSFHQLGLNVTLKPQSNSSASAIVEGYTIDQLQLLKTGLPQLDFTQARLRQAGRASTRPKNPARLPAIEYSATQSARPLMQVEFLDSAGRRWYVDQAERLNALGFNRFKGWECSSGYRSVIIREPNGEIKRSYSCSDKPLGSIDGGFQLFDRPQLCSTNSCVSSADNKIPKRKPNSKNPLWPGDVTFENSNASPLL